MSGISHHPYSAVGTSDGPATTPVTARRGHKARSDLVLRQAAARGPCHVPAGSGGAHGGGWGGGGQEEGRNGKGLI